METRAAAKQGLELALRKKREEHLESPWKWLLGKLEYTFNNHVPLDDFDNDTFSTIKEFRGTSWRGRDCDDLNPSIRPGTRSEGRDGTVDWNCNGIYGVDQE